MMNFKGFFRPKIRQPPKTKPQWSTGLSRLPDVLMKTLQRGDRKTFRRHLLRLAHHLSFVRAVTVQGDQQRCWPRRGNVQIVVKIDPRREGAVNVGISAGHWALILCILRGVSIAGSSEFSFQAAVDETS